MKRLLPLLLILAMSLTACKKDGCDPERNTSSLEEGKAIVMHYNQEAQRYYSIEAGENIVFRYNHSGAQCDDIMDDEYGYKVDFEVDKAADKFRYEGSELASAKAIFMEYGAWVGGQPEEIRSGLIEGSKISANKWRVKADVTVAPSHPNGQTRKISFNRVFEK